MTSERNLPPGWAAQVIPTLTEIVLEEHVAAEARVRTSAPGAPIATGEEKIRFALDAAFESEREPDALPADAAPAVPAARSPGQNSVAPVAVDAPGAPHETHALHALDEPAAPKWPLMNVEAVLERLQPELDHRIADAVSAVLQDQLRGVHERMEIAVARVAREVVAEALRQAPLRTGNGRAND